MTFHCYKNAKALSAEIRRLKAHGRPVICTEWMRRPVKSTVAECLGLFADADVGCLSWGLVNGKTQTHLPWGHRPENLPYVGAWQHDLYRGDMSPYDPLEIETIKATVKRKSR